MSNEFLSENAIHIKILGIFGIYLSCPNLKTLTKVQSFCILAFLSYR